MRVAWLVIVVLVVGFSILNDVMSTATSALQASQVANQTSARMLIVIALTLAFWFVGSERRVNQEARRDVNNDAPGLGGPVERRTDE